MFQYYSNAEKIAENYELYPQQRTYKAREISLSPFFDLNVDALLKGIMKGAFDTLPEPKILRRLWGMRDDYMPLHMSIATTSHVQHMNLQHIIDSGEELLARLKRIQEQYDRE